MKKETIQALVIALVVAVLFAMGLFMEEVNKKTVIFIVFGLIGSSILFIPTPWAIRLLFVYLGFEGFAKLITNYNPVVHVGADILVVMLCLRTLVLRLFYRQGLPGNYPPLTPLFVAHWFWFVIAIANPYSLTVVASLAAAKVYVTMVSLYFFGYYLCTSTEEVEKYMMPWILVLAIQTVTSIAQGIIGPSSVTSLGPGFIAALEKFKGYAFRPFGTTGLPGGPSIFIFITAPFLVYFLLHAKSVFSRILMSALLAGAFTALVFCQVRSALLKAIFGCALFMLFNIKNLRSYAHHTRRNIVIFISLFALTIVLGMPWILKKATESNEENEAAIERTLSLFDFDQVSSARSGALDRFIRFASLVPFGAGLSRTGPAAGKFKELIDNNPFFKDQFFFADNFWIATVIDLGIPGMLLLSAIVFAILIKGLKGLRRTTNAHQKVLMACILCAISSSVIGFYGAEAILYNPESAFFWFFSGALLRLAEDAEEKSGIQNI